MRATAMATVITMVTTSRLATGTWNGFASLETVPVGNPGNAGALFGQRRPVYEDAIRERGRWSTGIGLDAIASRSRRIARPARRLLELLDVDRLTQPMRDRQGEAA